MYSMCVLGNLYLRTEITCLRSWDRFEPRFVLFQSLFSVLVQCYTVICVASISRAIGKGNLGFGSCSYGILRDG